MRIAAFQQRFHDLIQYTAAAATPTAPNYLNVAAAHADGIEADGETTLPASVRTHLTYAYTRTRVTNAGFDTGLGATFVLGQPLMRRPAHTARFELARRVGVRADVIAGAAYSSRSDDRNFAAWPAVPVVLPARTLVDVAATMRLSRPGTPVPVHARFRADNLTNVRYQAIYGFQAPGRSVRVGLTLGAP